jgi:hypothetical protein
MNKNERPTMCIVHKGFRGFRAVSPASILGGKLIALNFLIPYDTIHSPLYAMLKKPTAQIAHLVFANTQANAKKPKELFFANARRTKTKNEIKFVG